MLEMLQTNEVLNPALAGLSSLPRGCNSAHGGATSLTAGEAGSKAVSRRRFQFSERHHNHSAVSGSPFGGASRFPSANCHIP